MEGQYTACVHDGRVGALQTAMAKSQQSQIRTKPFAIGLDDPLTRAIAPPPDESEAEKAERLTREAEAKRISDGIDEEIKREKIVWKRNKSLFKLLLLGQSESGQSPSLITWNSL